MPEFPIVKITRDELSVICRLPRKEVFPALRRTAKERGLIYHALDSDLKFKTRRDKAGNLYLQNFIGEADRD